MLKKLATGFVKPSHAVVLNRLAHKHNNLKEVNQDLDSVPTLVSSEFEKVEQPVSVLDTCEEDISHVAPYLRPTFNFAAYVNKSPTLQQLVHLGVDLYKLEKNAEVPPYLLALDFERDMKRHIMFLCDLGIQIEDIGAFVTKNPFIFKEDLENLKTRVNYLQFKKFDDAMILRIVQANPLWLSLSTEEIDKNLGFFQKSFALTGNEVRQLAVKSSKLITYNQKKVKQNIFVVKEEMGFTPQETKEILLSTPTIFMKDPNFLLKTFEYVHKTMNIPLEIIVKVPHSLLCRESRLKQRYLFLEKVGKTQFNPKKPNYISLIDLIAGSDSHFSTEVAGSSIQAFNTFLKSL